MNGLLAGATATDAHSYSDDVMDQTYFDIHATIVDDPDVGFEDDDVPEGSPTPQPIEVPDDVDWDDDEDEVVDAVKPWKGCGG